MNRNIRFLFVPIVVLTALLLISDVSFAEETKNSTVDISAVETSTLEDSDSINEKTYKEIMEEWDKNGITKISDSSYTINLSEYAENTQAYTDSEYADIQGYDDTAISLKEGDLIQVEALVEQSGLYAVRLDYVNDGSYNVDAIVSLKQDGSYPYEEAKNLILTQLLKSQEYPFDRDRNGDEIVPEAEYVYQWQSTYLRTQSLKTTEGLLFYFEEGINQITLTVEQGGVYLGNIYIESKEEVQIYDEYVAGNPQKGESSDALIIIEAERLTYKNSETPRAEATRDVEASPFESSTYLMSVIGGSTWQDNGEALYYEVEVETSGWYNLSFKTKQTSSGTVSNTYIHRAVTIDGKVPFEEADSLIFSSSNDWLVTTLGDEEGNNCTVYLEAGVHTIGIEVDATMLIPVADEITNLNSKINKIYLDICKIIGNNADLYRDWDLLEYIPDLADDLIEIAEGLEAQIEILTEINQGQDKNKVITSITMAAESLRSLAKDPDDIPNNMALLSEGTGSVSQTLGEITEELVKQPISLDQIYLWQDDAKLPDYEASIVTSLLEEFRYFLSSFQEDKTEEEEENSIVVWVNRASNYVDLMQKMTDAGFTTETGITVEFSVMPDEQKLILANTTGTQPDIAMGVSTYLPYDLAIRGVLCDLRQFENFNETASQFSTGAFITHTYEEGIYALPETQDFQVLFYRKDLFEKLNIPIPDTWDEVLEILPELQRYGMNFYAPTSLNSSFKTFSTTLPFFYQNGASLYSEDGLNSAINSENGISAMKFMTDLNTIYGVPEQVANFYQQFRNGTIPIGISGFADYLKLDSAAAELAGSWDIAVMPGVANEKGEVERWSTGGGQASVIFAKSDYTEESWEFLKWWTSTEVQVEFGTQIKLLYGDEYIWNSANLEAFKQMPINENHKEVILEQWEWLYEFPKTPASYMVEREISNVWNKVVLDGENVRSALDDSVISIDQEIERKMEEFGYMKDGEVIKNYEVPTIELIEGWLGKNE